MRLINTSTLELREFYGERPPYGILSHTWGSDEVTYQEWHLWRSHPNWGANGWRSTRLGIQKTMNFCQTLREKYMVKKSTNDVMLRENIPFSATSSFAEIDWCWVDTCCIDKNSSTELTEAINSMYKWYAQSVICIAYLEDVNGASQVHGTSIESSRWWSRGWTLQELIAPHRVDFYTQSWECCASKSEAAAMLSKISSIPEGVLRGTASLDQFPVASRFSWAAKRKTTRVEDIAYCLLGIFNVQMPLLYGEGQRAFRRLQEEIIKSRIDHSILAWRIPKDEPLKNYGALADDPSAFVTWTGFRRIDDIEDVMWKKDFSLTHTLRQAFAPSTNARRLWGITSRGLEATLPLISCRCRGQGKFYIDSFTPCRLAVLNMVAEDKMLVVHVDGYKRDGSMIWRSRGDTVDTLTVKYVRSCLKEADEWANLCKLVYLQLTPAVRSAVSKPLPDSVENSWKSVKKFLA